MATATGIVDSDPGVILDDPAVIFQPAKINELNLIGRIRASSFERNLPPQACTP